MERRRAPISELTVRFFSRDKLNIFRSRCVEEYATEKDARVAAYVYVQKGFILLAGDFKKPERRLEIETAQQEMTL